jgi:hypothetical protein
MKKFLVFLCGVLFLFGFTCPVSATPVFFGPTPYLSSADIPANFYQGGSPIGLEDFEDGSLGFGITVTTDGDFTQLVNPGDHTDSVDGDDGVIDGSGLDGYSWYAYPAIGGVTFTFASPVTTAGIVWTDGFGNTTFEAFGAGMTSLGTIGPVSIADGNFLGGTAEDRFFGVQDMAGIYAIKLSNDGTGGIEVDHVQFGIASVPEPATMLLFGSGLIGLVGFRRKKLFKE